MKNIAKIVLFWGCLPLFVSFAAVFYMSVQYVQTQSVIRQERGHQFRVRHVQRVLSEWLQEVSSLEQVDYEEFDDAVGEMAKHYDTEIVVCSTEDNTHAALTNAVGDTLGFIYMPFRVSEKQVKEETHKFLSRLMPVYVIVVAITMVFFIILFFALRARYDNLARQMKELEQSSFQIAKAERESAWRTMARQIAHEINNPLTPMKLTIQQMQRVKGTDRFDELFDRSAPMLVEQIDNLSRIASSFSTFAQMPQVEVSTVDVAQKLSDSIALFAHNDTDIPIRYIGPDEGVQAYADKNQIGQVFTNLIKNALQALQGKQGGDVLIVLKSLADEVEISISDNGMGIADELKDKIFAPYFTTKTTGTGLGLAISKNIVECAGGRIDFQTSHKGTTFYVHLNKKH